MSIPYNPLDSTAKIGSSLFSTYSIKKKSGATSIYQGRDIVSKGKITDRLKLGLCNQSEEDLYSIAIRQLSPKDQEKMRESKDAGWVMKHHWKPQTLKDESGNLVTVLVNINSALKRLKALGFTSEEVLKALDDNTLLQKMENNIIYQRASTELGYKKTEEGTEVNQAINELKHLGLTGKDVRKALDENKLLEVYEERKVFKQAAIVLGFNVSEDGMEVTDAINELKPLGLTGKDVRKALDENKLLEVYEERKVFKQAAIVLSFNVSEDGMEVTDAINELKHLGLTGKDVQKALDENKLLEVYEERKVFKQAAIVLGFNVSEDGMEVTDAINELKPLGLTGKDVLSVLNTNTLQEEIKEREIFKQAAAKLGYSAPTEGVDVKNAMTELKTIGFTSQHVLEALSDDKLMQDIKEKIFIHRATKIFGLPTDLSDQTEVLDTGLTPQQVRDIITASYRKRDIHVSEHFSNLQPIVISLDKFNEISGKIIRILENFQPHHPVGARKFSLRRQIILYKQFEGDLIFLNKISRNPDLMRDDPKLATKAHDILHNFAQEEIKAGNVKRAFEIESHVALAIPLSQNHPLYDMDTAILEGAAKQFDPKSGAYFSSLGSSTLKGGHLHATKRTIDQRECYGFDFKISHFARNELTSYLDAILANEEAFRDSLPENLKSVFKIESGIQQFVHYDETTGEFTVNGAYKPNASTATVLSFGSMGRIIIGNNKKDGCMYNKIMIEMDANCSPGEGIERLHKMLALAGIGPVLGQQTLETSERMKIAQLLRAYYPAIGTQLDVTKEFYELSIEKLKEKIIGLEPKMTEVFKKYLETSPELMQKIEIAPGKEMWGVMDLGSEMKNNGAWGLMSGVGAGGWLSAKIAIKRHLTEGALSSEQRFHKGVFKVGASSAEDFETGGGDQVFTRLVNNKLANQNICKFTFSGHAQILWNLDSIAPRVPYAYKQDEFGVKNQYYVGNCSSYSNYQTRDDLSTFSKLNLSTNNEVMIKNAVDPQHIVAVVVSSEANKLEIVNELLSEGLAERNELGEIYINVKGKKIKADDFIRVGDRKAPFSKEWWG